MRQLIWILSTLVALGATVGCDKIPFLGDDEGDGEETTAENPPETTEEAEEAIAEAEAAAEKAREEAEAVAAAAQEQAEAAQAAAGEAAEAAGEAAEEAGEAAEEAAEEVAEETEEAAEEVAQAGSDTEEAGGGDEGGASSATAACRGEADPNQCIIDRLEGRARYAHQLSALIDAHIAKGNRSAAIRNAREFIRRFRTHGRADRYRRYLQRAGVSVD